MIYKKNENNSNHDTQLRFNEKLNFKKIQIFNLGHFLLFRWGIW